MKSFLNFKSIDEQINEVLSKDATAGDWISDFIKSDNPKFAGKSKEKRKEMALAAYYAAQKNEAVIQPNGTDKIQPDEGMCEGLCQVCGATDCKEHFYKSPAVTGYVKEATVDTADIEKNKVMTNKDKNTLSKLAALMAKEKKSIKEESLTEEHTVHVDDGSKYDEEPHPKDAEHVMAGVKKHGGKFAGHSDKGAYFKFGSRTDAKNFVDHVKKSPHRSVSADLHESRGHKILATAMANAERMKTVQIPTPAERRAELEKQNKEKQMKEAAEKKPYIVISHVSDNTGTRAGGEKVEKNRVATKLIATSPEHALQLSKAHHEKSGRKVHSASIKEEVDMGQADRTLRSKDKSGSTYHVKDSSGKIISTHDNHSDAMRGALKHDDHKVVKEAVDTVKKDASGKVIAWSHEGDWEKNSTKKQGTGKAANLAGQALQKTKSLNKEEVDLDEDAVSDYRDKKRSEREAEHAKQDPKHSVRYAKNMVDVDKAAKKAKERGIKVDPMDFNWKVRNGVQRGKLPEEVELEESWEVYDTKTRAIHSSHPTQRKALNAMNKLNDKHPGYETPGNLIASKFGARVSKLKEETLDEVTLQAHKVGVTVSDPNHTSVSQRKEKVQKSVIVKATDKGEAQAKAEAFYKKKGYKVHDSFHHSVVPATSMKTEEVTEGYTGRETKDGVWRVFKDGQGAVAGPFKSAEEASAWIKKHNQGMNESAWGKDKATNLRQAHDRHMEKALAANKAGDDEAVKTHQRKMQMIQGKLQKLKNNEEVELGEECEILSELDKKTLGNYVKKAHDQLMKHTSSVATKYARGDRDAMAYALDDTAVRKTANRTKGVDQAINKLTKEDTMVTYKEFMASIDEGRIDDLKDKLAADREKRLNKMDYSKEKEAAKNPVTKVKGHSYGAGDEEGEAETTKPAEPAEKRGRGRPAGSKSGATKYN